MSGHPNQPPQAFSYPQYYNPAPGQPGAYPGQPAGQPGFPGQPSMHPVGQPAGQPGFPGQPSMHPVGQPAGHQGFPGQPSMHPVGQPGFPGQPGYGQPPAPGQPQYAPQPGFAYQNVYPSINPTPTAPEFGYPAGFPNVTPQPSYGSFVQWVPTTSRQAIGLSDRAVVAGYEGHDGSPLWVIRAKFQGDIIPGKLAIKHQTAYVPWGGKENQVQDIEVCCAPPEKIKWVDSRDGEIPPTAVPAGNTSSGEPLYVGRVKEQGSLTPGKVHPSHKAMYISFAGNEVPHKIYQIMCSA